MAVGIANLLLEIFTWASNKSYPVVGEKQMLSNQDWFSLDRDCAVLLIASEIDLVVRV